LIKKYSCRCFIYLEKMRAADLQIDHRVPYEVAGDAEELKMEDFMLLCGKSREVMVVRTL